MRLPKGFKASAVASGIKPKGLDLALIFSESPCKVAGAFTSNRVKAAPVIYSRRILKGGMAQAIIANSGCANACTGKEGLKDAEEMAKMVERALNLHPRSVLVASTGVIGKRLPLENVKSALPSLIEGLSPQGFQDVALAIMTTDRRPKIKSVQVKCRRLNGTILGIAKGAGMISPNLATMLCFLLTDLICEPQILQSCLREAISLSFNRISVDGEQSTNDTVFLMANGLEGTLEEKEISVFKEALTSLTMDLAKEIVKDAEGATKFVQISVKGAKSDSEAKKAAFRIANSLLVKTALFGEDPNWGRIMAALGDSGAKFNPDKVCLWINGLKVVSEGKGINMDHHELKKALKNKEILIELDLKGGNGNFKVFTCDLSYDYVKINAEYTT
jgi:glutamate N-acetyltransferase/amino-acid N-acetyltransferase